MPIGAESNIGCNQGRTAIDSSTKQSSAHMSNGITRSIESTVAMISLHGDARELEADSSALY